MKENNLEEANKRIDELENKIERLQNGQNVLVEHFHELVGATLESIKENSEK